ncbi:uncharacterized protein [Argopecten irradians]|uniref:uncharacterized protein n=1 Tax=Argopecten irradians TaxID=31199 RepID=UPI00371FAF9B
MKITLLCLTVLVITVHADTNLRLNRNTALHASHHHYTTCHKTMFGDPRCYKVVSNNYEYIMQCGAGTYFDNNTCSCDLQTSSLPHDLAPVDCHHLHSQLSTSAHSLSTVSCSSSSYSFLELAKTNQHCLSADSVWSHLQLVKTHDSIDCVKKIINDMNAYYGAWNSQHGRMPCACNHVYKYIRKPTEDTSHCYYHDSGFHHLYRTVFGSRDTFNENTIGRSCSSHNTVWKYLELTATKHTSDFCLELLIQIISEAYHNLPGNVQCSSCQETGHTDVTMTVSPVVHSSHDCRQNQAYKELMAIFSTDMCVSYTKVWGPLKAIGSYSHDCLVEAIKELTGRSNHFDNSSCSCSHSSLHDLVLGHISGGQYSDCELHFHDSYHSK